MVLPLRNGDALVQDFEDFFAHQIMDKVGFPEAVFRRAADLRAQLGFKTPDALHLAAAVEAACDVFLTNDAQLTRFTGIAVEVV
jgi:predicted nucleic acid-binding protein